MEFNSVALREPHSISVVTCDVRTIVTCTRFNVFVFIHILISFVGIVPFRSVARTFPISWNPCTCRHSQFYTIRWSSSLSAWNSFEDSGYMRKFPKLPYLVQFWQFVCVWRKNFRVRQHHQKRVKTFPKIDRLANQCEWIDRRRNRTKKRKIVKKKKETTKTKKNKLTVCRCEVKSDKLRKRENFCEIINYWNWKASPQSEFILRVEPNK